MSMFLFDEQPILANKVLARELGLNEALVLQQINYWLEINKRSGNNYHDGRYWTYNSIRAWHESDFDYMSEATVKRTFAKLEKLGYLVVGNYNKDPRDKTKWYSLNEQRLFDLYLKLENDKKEKEKKILEENQKKILSNALGQNEPMEEVKMNQWTGSKCTNGLEQNEPTHCSELNQPLPEITTKTSTENSSYISSKNSFHPSIVENQNVDNLNVDNFKLDIKTEGKEGNKKNIYKNNYYECLDELKKQVEYDFFDKYEPHTAYTIREILPIIADVMVLEEGYVTINQNKVDVDIVKDRFRKLDSSMMRELVDVVNKPKNKVRNIRSFILTSAYNLPSNLDLHYTAMVGYDSQH